MKNICAYLEDRKRCIDAIVHNLPYRQSLSYIEHSILCELSDALSSVTVALSAQNMAVQIDSAVSDILTKIVQRDISNEIIFSGIVAAVTTNYINSETNVCVDTYVIEQYASLVRDILTELSCEVENIAISAILRTMLSQDMSLTHSVGELLSRVSLAMSDEIPFEHIVNTFDFTSGGAEITDVCLTAFVSAVLVTYLTLGELDSLTLAELDKLSLEQCSVIIYD